MRNSPDPTIAFWCVGPGTVVRVGQGKQALREAGEPVRVGLGQGQSQGKSDGAGAHGGQVGQVHGQRLVAQHARVSAGKEVAVLDQHVGRDGKLAARRDGEQGAVVADAQRRAARPVALEVALDEVEFGEHGGDCTVAPMAGQRGRFCCNRT